MRYGLPVQIRLGHILCGHLDCESAIRADVATGTMQVVLDSECEAMPSFSTNLLNIWVVEATDLCRLISHSCLGIVRGL